MYVCVDFGFLNGGGFALLAMRKSMNEVEGGGISFGGFERGD